MKRELELLKEKMRETGVDACLIPTSDFHGSEYVGDYFKCRQFISGFTGSAGAVVVTLDEAGLWKILSAGGEAVRRFRNYASEGTTARSACNRGIFKTNIKERRNSRI